MLIHESLNYLNFILYNQQYMYPIKLHASERNINTARFNYDGDLLFCGSAEK